MVFRPLYIEEMLPFVEAPFVKIIAGIGRYGKSTILRVLVEELKKCGGPQEHMLFYNFDSLELYELKSAKWLYDNDKLTSSWHNIRFSLTKFIMMVRSTYALFSNMP